MNTWRWWCPAFSGSGLTITTASQYWFLHHHGDNEKVPAATSRRASRAVLVLLGAVERLLEGDESEHKQLVDDFLNHWVVKHETKPDRKNIRVWSIRCAF
eukprot:1195221-Prorocentrum_minimum.AAC.3